MLCDGTPPLLVVVLHILKRGFACCVQGRHQQHPYVSQLLFLLHFGAEGKMALSALQPQQLRTLWVYKAVL